MWRTLHLSTPYSPGAMRAIRSRSSAARRSCSSSRSPTPQPGAGEVLIKVSRAGINFADTHPRENNYLAKAELPLVPGGEVAGGARRPASA